MNQFLLFILLSILIISFIVHICISYATNNEGLRRFLNILNIALVFLGSITLHSLWEGQSWVKWTLSLGIPIAFYAIVLLLTLLFDVIVYRSSSVAIEDCNRWLSLLKNGKKNLKQDMESFIKYCIIDEQDPYTTELFEK